MIIIPKTEFDTYPVYCMVLTLQFLTFDPEGVRA
jgi:hypothetical protein